MTRKATKKKTTKKPATKKKAPPKPKPVTVYIVVRELPAEVTTYTDPTHVFASKKAALAHAVAMNLELRAMTNPFARSDPEYDVKGGEKAFLAILKKLGVPVPKKPKGNSAYIEWDEWWDNSYSAMSDDQRTAIWDALDKFNWYKVKQTTVE